MSLRDALVAKGLVSKKDARRVNQEAQADRRQAQGARRAKHDVAAEAAEAQRAAEAEAVRERAEARKRREAAREEAERQITIRNLIRSNQIRSRGKYRFFHRAMDGVHVPKLEVSDRVAWALRCGECAIVAILDGPEATYGVVNARAAHRLREIAPERVVHFVEDTTGLSDPAEAFYLPEWEISLVPRRAP